MRYAANLDLELNNTVESLVTSGDISSAERHLLGKLDALHETKFHIVKDLEFSNPKPIADHLKGFYRRQAKRFDVALLYAEMNDFTLNPHWGYAAFAYDVYNGLGHIDNLPKWKGQTTPYALNGMYKLMRGFPKKYLQPEFASVREVTRLLVSIKFIKLMQQVATNMKTVTVPFVVSVHDSSLCAEFHPSAA